MLCDETSLSSDTAVLSYLLSYQKGISPLASSSPVFPSSLACSPKKPTRKREEPPRGARKGAEHLNATDHLGGVSSEAATPTHSASRKKRGMLPPLTPGDFNRVGKLGSNLSIALAGLWANRLRSLLTTLGIFIG